MAPVRDHRRSSSRPHGQGASGEGQIPLFALAVFVLVFYLAVARPDIQQPPAAPSARTA